MVYNLAHQAVDDYRSMTFDFPDENIMLVTDCAKLGPYEGPEQGSRWTMIFDGASNALGNGVGVVIVSPEGFHTLSLLDYASVVQITWLNMRHPFWV